MTGILFFYSQAGQRYREELGLARVAARGEHARNLRTHDHRRQFAAAEVRDRLEEDVGRFEVGEQQAVRIAGHRRTLDLFVLGDLLVERHVQRQRSGRRRRCPSGRGAAILASSAPSVEEITLGSSCSEGAMQAIFGVAMPSRLAVRAR